MDGKLSGIPYEGYIKDCGHDTSNMLFDVFYSRNDSRRRRCLAELDETGFGYSIDRWGYD